MKRIERPPNISELLPPTVLTLSSCFADIAPDLWAVDWKSYPLADVAAEAAKFGIKPHLAAELMKWVTAQTTGEHPNAFRSTDTAREFRRRFSVSSDVLVVGKGLHTSLLASFHEQLGKESNRGYGLLDRVERKEQLAGGGDFLGYEPLGYDATSFHTWLCHSMPDEAKARFGIIPNENGLISNLRDAVELTRHMVETGAEPGIWEPWLLVSYPFSSK